MSKLKKCDAVQNFEYEGKDLLEGLIISIALYEAVTWDVIGRTKKAECSIRDKMLMARDGTDAN